MIEQISRFSWLGSYLPIEKNPGYESDEQKRYSLPGRRKEEIADSEVQWKEA